MERRLESRHPSDLLLHVTALEEGAEPVSGALVNLSDSGVCALLSMRLPDACLVKLELADTVLYGQVVYCCEENGTFRTGISVERVLFQATDLAAILGALIAPHDEQARAADSRQISASKIQPFLP
jgi:hypothetical protein